MLRRSLTRSELVTVFERRTGLPFNRRSLAKLRQKYPALGDDTWLTLDLRCSATLELILAAWQRYQLSLTGFAVGDRVTWKPGSPGVPPAGTVGVVTEPWLWMASGVPVDSLQKTGIWVWHPSGLVKVEAPRYAAS